jgi:hypothetical protein
MKYGQIIKWTWFDGSKENVEVYDCETMEEALGRSVCLAEASGWTYPKWWEWWRWNDTRPPMKHGIKRMPIRLCKVRSHLIGR